jgi:FkbH-like protein
VRDLYTDLAWLLPAPPDFRAQCRALIDSPELNGAAVRRLANHALSETQLSRLAEVAGALRTKGGEVAPLTPLKLGIVSNATTDLLIDALVGSAARHGILLECVQAGYGQIMQEALSADSTINSARPDAVLLAIDYRALPRSAELTASGAPDALTFVNALRAGFRRHSGAVSIVSTFSAPPEALFGGFERAVPGTVRASLEALNRELVTAVGASEDLLLDVAALAETVGAAQWHSPEQWNFAKLPFSSTFVPLYADHVGRLLGALRGKARRCLILDLDNTLWGGVIGDDGLDGIQCAQGDATGEAFLEVQRMALQLRARGIVLAVASKNTEQIARSVFREHPEMLLRERHIAVFQANWTDKATNIKAIAGELALGLDAMVFVDDNPVERNLVRQILPEVAVPELPEDPALYARTVLAAGYFEATRFSTEDRQRADFYQDNARRVALQNQAGDVDAYLASLRMEIRFAPFDAAGRARIAQLINKSNQFNLTTRRYTEAEVAAAQDDPDCFTLQIRLTDLFGDNGMISVIICRPRAADEWLIDTWLMSCRVLARRVEQMVLHEIVLHARQRGIKRLIGMYKPTGRNGLVQEHYAKLGFTQVDAGDAASKVASEAAAQAGTTVWTLSTDADVEAPPMTVHRSGLPAPTLERAPV